MPPARIGHRFQQLGQTMQSSFAQQALGLLFTESREDTLACDTIHERRLLERRVGLLSLSYLSWEASLSNNSQALTMWIILVPARGTTTFRTNLSVKCSGAHSGGG